VHGVDDAGQVVIRRQLKRRYVLTFFQKLPPCMVGIEACASSALLLMSSDNQGERLCVGTLAGIMKEISISTFLVN
jgi:hypothetical protein